MNFLICLNRAYLFPAKVLCASIIANHPGKSINFWVLHSPFDVISVNDFETFKKDTTVDFCIKQVDLKVFDNMQIPMKYNQHITIEAYFRILILNYIPKTVDRILYLDTDTICNKDLSKIYGIDLKGNLIAACVDKGFDLKPTLKKELYRNLNFQSKDKYYNSGVVLFDLERIRTEISTDIFLNFIKENYDKILFHDQDILNSVFKGRIYTLPPEMNCRPFSHFHTQKAESYIYQTAYIIHYGQKPWHSNYTDICGSIFWTNAKSAQHYEEYKTFKHENEKHRAHNRYSIYASILKRNIKIFLFSLLRLTTR